MRRIWAVVILLITYGSLYPFEFYTGSIPGDLFLDFTGTWDDPVFQGDFLANIIIFIPYGLIGWFVFDKKPELRLLAIIVSGFLFGMGLQLLQYCLPSRTPSIVDGWSNLIGIVLGCMLGWRLSAWQRRNDVSINTLHVAPVTLILGWFGFRLMPFIPFFRWKQIEISLRPIYVNPQLNLVSVYANLTAWLAIFYLLSKVVDELKPRAILVLVIGCFAFETLIIYNYLFLYDVLGAMLAIGLWFLFSAQDRLHRYIYPLLVFHIVLNGLTPFKFMDTTMEFHWIPFTGLLGGSVFFNLATFFHKFFFYGCAIWFGVAMGLRWRYATAIIAVLSLGIELIQTRLIGHVAEITDPIFIVIIGWLLHTTGKGRFPLPLARAA